MLACVSTLRGKWKGKHAGLSVSPSEPYHLPISELSFQASVEPVCEEPVAERPHVKISIYKADICRITINARAVSGTLISDSSMPQLKYSKVSLADSRNQTSRF